MRFFIGLLFLTSVSVGAATWSPVSGKIATHSLKVNCETIEGVDCIESTSCQPDVCSPVAGVMTSDSAKVTAKNAAATEETSKASKRATLNTDLVACAKAADLNGAEQKACLIKMLKIFVSEHLAASEL